MTINNRFAVLLAEKSALEKRRISVAEVSRMTGIAQRTLQQWYSNKISRFDAPVMDALCNYFGCQPGNLFEYQKQ
jgi:putative transcriptional regulator